MDPKTKISSKHSCRDWLEVRRKLDGDEASAWGRAVDIVRDRLTSRFLEPIRRLQKDPDAEKFGFGFAILTLDCALIDAIQSFREGRAGADAEASTAKAFKTFLKAKRFKEFSSNLREEFFRAIRSGLMHDGETRKGWLIRKKSGKGRLVEKKKSCRILYRDDFHEAIEEEFDDYLKLLPKDQNLRKNFRARMDAICELQNSDPKINHFAYGSNMRQTEILRKGAKTASFLGVALLHGYRLAFNKRGQDGTGKANIQVSEETASIRGCLYEISPEDLENLRRHERGYFEKEIKVELAFGAIMPARTFIAQSTMVFRGETSPGYLDTIIAGAKEKGLPPDYIASVLDAARLKK